MAESKRGGKSSLLIEMVCSVQTQKLHLIFMFFKTFCPTSILKKMFFSKKNVSFLKILLNETFLLFKQFFHPSLKNLIVELDSYE